MGEFAIGQPVPRFEDPRLVKGGGRYVADMVFPGMAFGYVLRSPHAPCPNPLDRHRRRRPRPACSRCSPAPTGRKRASANCRRPAGSSAATAHPCSSRPIPALAEDRVRWVGDTSPSSSPRRTTRPRRRRTGRGRLRAAAGGRLDRATRQPGVPPSGTTARTTSASSRSRATRRRPTRPSPRPRISSSTVSSSTASRRRRMEPRGCVGVYHAGRRPLHHPHAGAARASYRRRDIAQRAESAGKQSARHLQRHRRQLRHEVRRFSTKRRWCCFASKLTGRPVKWMARAPKPS